MKPALEAPLPVRAGTSFVAFERRARRFEWNWHYHPELELTWIRRGSGRRLVGDHAEAYRAGDLVLLGPNVPHTWFSDEDSIPNCAVVVQFRPWPDDLLRLPEFAGVAALLGGAGAGLRLSPRRDVTSLLRRLPESHGLAGWLQLMELLNILAAGKAVPLASPRYRHRRARALHSRLERVVAHIEENFRSDLTLEKAAKVAGLTPSAFSRFFRRMTHQTFVDFRNACRIREAGRLLVDTDYSVTRIAGECGFENLANFNRRFREEKTMTPREFRRLHERPPQAGE